MSKNKRAPRQPKAPKPAAKPKKAAVIVPPPPPAADVTQPTPVDAALLAKTADPAAELETVCGNCGNTSWRTHEHGSIVCTVDGTAHPA